ncbi:MAG: rubrerythrin [Acidobacteria bacterium]|nr:rubrerythrin [Acidobacteriota bacterium]
MGLPIDFTKLKAHDALDIAVYAEQEAQEQYEHFASLMDADGKADAAAFFRRMAKLEDRHRAQVAARRAELFRDVPVSIRNVTSWGVEVADQSKLDAKLTLRDALLVALEAEVRARDYYSEAMEHLTEPQVNELFGELRDSEIEHQRLLKAELEKL